MDPESDNSTLVKYDNPRLVTTTNPDTNNKKGRRLINTARVSCSKTEDILSSILPPREFTTSDGQLWVQSVSSTPSTRQDVIALEKQLDSKLQDGEVRASGLCPVREKLYAQVGKCSNRCLIVAAEATMTDSSHTTLRSALMKSYVRLLSIARNEGSFFSALRMRWMQLFLRT